MLERAVAAAPTSVRPTRRAEPGTPYSVPTAGFAPIPRSGPPIAAHRRRGRELPGRPPALGVDRIGGGATAQVLQPPPARVHAPGTVSGVYPRLFAPIVSPRKVAGRRAPFMSYSSSTLWAASRASRVS